MELALLASLGAVGYYMNQNDNKEPLTDVAKIPSNYIPTGRDVYNNNRLTEKEYERMQKAERNYLDSQNPQKTNIVANYYNQLSSKLDRTKFNGDFSYDKIESLYDNESDIDHMNNIVKANASSNDILNEQVYERSYNLVGVSENLSSNEQSLNRISNKTPEYLAQFEEPAFDNPGTEVPHNTVNQYAGPLNKEQLALMERKLSLDGGWTVFQPNTGMDYGMVSKEEFVHNNMYPSFSTKHGYGSNDYGLDKTQQMRMEFFTGTDPTYQNHKETSPHFNPVADMTNVFGAPVRPEEEISRFIPSLYRQNEFLQDPVRITPGVNEDYNAVGTHGFHPMYRVLDRTVDDLRVKSRPKVSHEGRVVSGMHGRERPQQAAVISYKPDSYKTTTSKDYVPMVDETKGPYTRENYYMKETDRSHQHIEYTGHAFNRSEEVGQNVPDYMMPKIKYSTNQNFTLPDPEQRYEPGMYPYGSNSNNVKSYNLQETQRSITGEDNRSGTAYRNQIGSQFTDIARSTIKETTHADYTNLSVLKPNDLRGTVHSYGIAAPTIKELMIDQPLNPIIGNTNGQRIYHSDDIRTTTKDLMTENVVPANIFGGFGEGPANAQDNFRTTVKETTLNPTNTMMRGSEYGILASVQDPIRTTIKETTLNPTNTIIGTNQYGIRSSNQDTFRTTIKETTLNPLNTMLRGAEYGIRASNQDNFRTTIKETTLDPTNTMMKGEQHGFRTSIQDQIRTTTKETTLAPVNTMMTPFQMGYVANFQDVARTTGKETIVDTKHLGHANSQSRGSTVNFQDTAKATVKETTIDNEHFTNVKNTVGGGGLGYLAENMQAKTTVKETIIDNKHVLNAKNTVAGGGLGYMAENMEAKNTNRQFTSLEPERMNIMSQNEHRPRLYHDAYNAQIDDRKEILVDNFRLTLNGAKTGPGKEEIRMQNRKRSDIERTPNLGKGTSNTQYVPGLFEVKRKDTVPQSFSIDSSTRSALRTNPYHINHLNEMSSEY